MAPDPSTDWGWQPLQDAAVPPPFTGGWPAGGMPWQDVQVTEVVSVQVGVALEPLTPLKEKLPWQ
jgi:hypothetical protein